MLKNSRLLHNSRLGFHYFPDSLHYRERDLSIWIPELISLGTSWITLLAPGDRAIPEYFLNGLLDSGIEPILQFNLPLASSPKVEETRLLLEAYRKWGIHYAVFYDRPNRRASWPPTLWAQDSLVEHFLDRFLLLAELSLQSGLTPVFPPMTPGGDYWDTSFLRESLQSIERRGYQKVLENLILGAYAIAGEHPLTWGCGGPERWPAAGPYNNSSETQDHRGVCIHEWYSALSQAAIGITRPIILFGLASRSRSSKNPFISEEHHIRRILAISQALSPTSSTKSQINTPHPRTEGLDPFPSYVLAGNFWLLSADHGTPHDLHAWFHTDGSVDRRVDALRSWITSKSFPGSQQTISSIQHNSSNQPIQHYLLIPTFDWGISDWHLSAARPFIHKYQPTIGFSVEEAKLASRVTIVGGADQYSDEDLNSLRAAGCVVERIDGDGMSIATQLIDR